MIYKFFCPKCGENHNIEMKISEYHSDNHMCKNCGTELQRNVRDYAGASVWHCQGAYGVGNHN